MTNPKSAPGPGDVGPMPPGYYEIPEYECPTCGPLYADEVEAGECKICGESVLPDMEDDE